MLVFRVLLECQNLCPLRETTIQTGVEQTIRLNISEHLTEHNYRLVTPKGQSNIDMKYADDISKLTSNRSSKENFKHHIPEVLESRVLRLAKIKPNST